MWRGINHINHTPCNYVEYLYSTYSVLVVYTGLSCWVLHGVHPDKISQYSYTVLSQQLTPFQGMVVSDSNTYYPKKTKQRNGTVILVLPC